MTSMTKDSSSRRVDTFGCSRTGAGHAVNGDQFLVAELKRAAQVHHASQSNLDDSRHFGANQAHVLLVADSSSAKPGRRSASSLVIDEVMDSILNVVPWSRDLDVVAEAALRQQLKKTVMRCNDEISKVALTMDDSGEMASTMTMAFVRWPTAFIVHAGDSRAFLLRDEDIEQLTTDHTFAQQMVDEGHMDPDRADTSRLARMLWNAVGGDSKVTPELTVKALRPGDSLLLCSGGLATSLDRNVIRDLCAAKTTSRKVCEELVRVAVREGSQDDLTAAMARFEEEAEVLAADAPPDTKVQAEARTERQAMASSRGDRAALMAAQASA